MEEKGKDPSSASPAQSQENTFIGDLQAPFFRPMAAAMTSCASEIQRRAADIKRTEQEGGEGGICRKREEGKSGLNLVRSKTEQGSHYAPTARLDSEKEATRAAVIVPLPRSRAETLS